jgi:hypothetical protein
MRQTGTTVTVGYRTMAAPDVRLARRATQHYLLGMSLVSWWVEQSTLAQVGSAFAALLLSVGLIAIALAIRTAWRDWSRSLV